MIQYSYEFTLEDYQRLRKAVGWAEIREPQAEKGLQNSAFKIAATDNSLTVGMARLISDGGYVSYIADVVVMPEYQKLGIGKAMVSAILDYIRENMEEGDRVMVCLLSAKGKEPFYQTLSFTERPDELGGAGMTQWLTK